MEIEKFPSKTSKIEELNTLSRLEQEMENGHFPTYKEMNIWPMISSTNSKRHAAPLVCNLKDSQRGSQFLMTTS